jgi:hypothetical protein
VLAVNRIQSDRVQYDVMRCGVNDIDVFNVEYRSRHVER